MTFPHAHNIGAVVSWLRRANNGTTTLAQQYSWIMSGLFCLLLILMIVARTMTMSTVFSLVFILVFILAATICITCTTCIAARVCVCVHRQCFGQFIA